MALRKLTTLFAVLLLGLVASNSRLFAQGTDLGTLRGTVADPSGAVVPNARVEITDLDTHTVQVVNTDGHGLYQAAALPSGHYQITVSAEGFSPVIVKGIVLTGSDVVGANAVLRAAGGTVSVDVSSSAPLIDTQDQTLSQSISSQAIIDLPRDSRDIYSFLYINPNITQGSGPGEYKFIGAQSYGASFSVDGQRTNGGIFGSVTQSQPSLEAVGDLNVLSSTFSAEYAGIANIRVTTKRGGANYHGSLFYNNKNSALSAWSLADKDTLANFAPTFNQPTFNKPRFNITDFGGSIGGPVAKVKNTWFFLAYEHNSSILPTSATSTRMPHPTLLTGDFSMMRDSAKPSVGSAVLTPSEIANNTVGGLGQKFISIPQRLLNPVTTKLISLYYPKIGTSALINPGTGSISPHFTVNYPGNIGQHEGTLRIDHNFSDKDRVYGVYHASAQNTATSPVVGVFTGLGLRQVDRRNNTISLSYTHIFSSSLVNEARGGFNKQHLYTHSNTTLSGFLSSIGFSAADIAAYGAVVGSSELNTHGHLAINFGSGGGAFQAFSNGGRNTDRPADQNIITFGDTVTWTRGRHSVRMGADFVRNQALDGFAVNRGNVRGLVTYNGTGANALARFLQGNPADSAAFVDQPRPAMDVYNWESGYFVQDDFRINSRLTLNLGMRYDLVTPFVDSNDLMVNFDPNYRDTNTGQIGRFVIPSAKTLTYLDPNVVGFGYVLANQSGLGIGRGLVRLYKNGFGPRVGLAYSLNDKTVLRGGYGLYYPTSAAQGIRDPLATNSFNQGRTKRSTGGSPLSGWPTGSGPGTSPITGGTLAGFGNTPTANYVPVDLRNPRIQQWNATIEREIPWQSSLRFSYIGAHQSGQIVGRDINMIPANDNPFGTTTGDGVTPCDPFNNGDCSYSPADMARLKIPALGDYVTGFGNVGHSMSTSFQGQFQRSAPGVTFSLNYTYQDQKSSGLDTGNSSLGGGAYNPFSPDSDYGTDSYVSRHRVVAYGLFDLPFGRGKRYGSSVSRWADAAIGGWQASTNLFFKTGVGFTPFYVCDDCDPVLPGNVASGAIDAVGDFNATSIRAVISGSPNSGATKGYQWNPNAFAFPSIGGNLYTQAGIAARNSIYGPSMYGVNLGVHKAFHINDRVSLQLGADVNNVFNHPMLSPDSNDGGGCEGCFSNVGSFSLKVDQSTPGTPGSQPKILPVDTSATSDQFSLNPDFGHKFRSYEQEGIDSNRSIRLRGRITF
ncbi:MAG: carboxypeptidase regulatory-like domain-containing protein [Acidobacteria bacterium]|nr:carboxypeptidase regulatory-like domain-containing protein [Acidobacteriota bacterium]